MVSHVGKRLRSATVQGRGHRPRGRVGCSRRLAPHRLRQSRSLPAAPPPGGEPFGGNGHHRVSRRPPTNPRLIAHAHLCQLSPSLPPSLLPSLPPSLLPSPLSFAPALALAFLSPCSRRRRRPCSHTTLSLSPPLWTVDWTPCWQRRREWGCAILRASPSPRPSISSRPRFAAWWVNQHSSPPASTMPLLWKPSSSHRHTPSPTTAHRPPHTTHQTPHTTHHTPHTTHHHQSTLNAMDTTVAPTVHTPPLESAPTRHAPATAAGGCGCMDSVWVLCYTAATHLPSVPQSTASWLKAEGFMRRGTSHPTSLLSGPCPTLSQILNSRMPLLTSLTYLTCSPTRTPSVQEGLPLNIISVGATAAAFADLEPFPPSLVPAGAPPPAGSPTLCFSIQFESSGKWPDDLGAISALKTAFYLKLACVPTASKRRFHCPHRTCASSPLLSCSRRSLAGTRACIRTCTRACMRTCAHTHIRTCMQVFPRGAEGHHL